MTAYRRLFLAALGLALGAAAPVVAQNLNSNDWALIESGRILVTDRHNVLTYTVAHNATSPDRVQFQLTLLNDNIYNKSLFLTQADHTPFTNLTGFVLVDDGPVVFGDLAWHAGMTVTPRHRAAHMDVLRSELTPGTQLELRKDNFMFGYSTAAFLFGLNNLQGGDRVTFNWIDERN